jgi:UDP-glucose 4-epimerase
MLTLDVNVIGTVNVLIAGGTHGIKKFIFSSTGGAMYGEPRKIPADETMEPTPLSPYALSKNLDELCIKFYAKSFGFDYLIFRYANVYGPRQNPRGEAGVVAIFGGLMKKKLRPTIFGDGTKTRDYIYVGDIARANILALRRGEDVTLNLGLGKEIKDQTVFDTIARNTKFNGKPIYAPFRKGECQRISITNRRAKTVLGWKPRTEFNEGIKKTLRTLTELP